ncbi:unnamed protein product, partial [Ascophyllum nodosum]
MWGVIIQDNTCFTNRYHLKLCLIIGVDSENKSRVLAQAFLSDEQTASFEYVLNHFVKICGGYPQVIITDADTAMTCTVSAILPGTTYLYCLWHI